MKWSSDTFYKAKLVADESVKSRLLADLPGVASNENTQVPLGTVHILRNHFKVLCYFKGKGGFVHK